MDMGGLARELHQGQGAQEVAPDALPHVKLYWDAHISGRVEFAAVCSVCGRTYEAQVGIALLGPSDTTMDTIIGIAEAVNCHATVEGEPARIRVQLNGDLPALRARVAEACGEKPVSYRDRVGESGTPLMTFRCSCSTDPKTCRLHKDLK